MVRLFQYFSKYQGVRGSVGGMPAWARTILAIVAIPGIVLIGLSILALCVSILALLLLTMPVYRVLSMLVGSEAGSRADYAGGVSPFGSIPEGGIAVDVNTTVLDAMAAPTQPRRQVEVKIIEDPTPEERRGEEPGIELPKTVE